MRRKWRAGARCLQTYFYNATCRTKFNPLLPFRPFGPARHEAHNAEMLRITRAVTTLVRSTELSTTVTLVDSFARKPFSGNPAAIVFAHGKTAWMQSLATELNIPVTAFVDNSENGGLIRVIRWYDVHFVLLLVLYFLMFHNVFRFTPKKELTICGHATLAAAHTLFTASSSFSNVIFRSEYCGVMTATKSSSGAVQFTFPAEDAPSVSLCTEDQTKLLSALEIDSRDVVFSGRTESDLIVELTRASFSRVAQIVDYSKLATLSTRGVIITCVGKRRVPSSENDSYHCVSCGGHAYMNDQTYDYLLRAFYPRYCSIRSSAMYN
jgi:predicted PhzF superfamily epimerase YddE/YHI9